MALTSSGQLKLSEIQTEWGGSNPIGLSEYYTGGTLVSATSGNTGRVITNIPASGTIKISNFYSTAAGTAGSSSADVTITITFGNSGLTRGYGSSYGSISPTQYDSVDIEELSSTYSPGVKGSPDQRGFRVKLDGSRAQGFFTSVDVGTLTFTSATATHSQSGGVTTWQWGPSASYNTALAAWEVSNGSTATVDFNE